MCKLGNAKAARLKPPPLKIATILGPSSLHEVARESEAIDLKYIFKVQKTKQESHRLIRWALYLSGFDFTIQFCSGNSPEIAMSDFLSRYDYEDQVEEVGALAHSFTVDELERLEADCVDFRTQSTTKVAEEQLPIIPDVEQMIRLY